VGRGKGTREVGNSICYYLQNPHEGGEEITTAGKHGGKRVGRGGKRVDGAQRCGLSLPVSVRCCWRGLTAPASRCSLIASDSSPVLPSHSACAPGSAALRALTLPAPRSLLLCFAHCSPG